MRHALHILYIIGLAIVAIAQPRAAHAQNNLYGVDDECYAIMLSMNVNTDSEPEFLRKARLMYDLAVKKHDTKAQTLAQSNILVYYDTHHDIEKIKKQAEVVRNEARRTGHGQYYYYAYNRVIENLLYIDIEEAMRLAKQMTREADADQSSPYGKFSSYQQLGHVYKARNNPKLSIEYYKKALEVAPLLPTRQRTSAIYLSIADQMDSYDERMSLYDKALAEAIEPMDTLRTLQAMCTTYGLFSKIRKFYECYSQAEQMFHKIEMGMDGFETDVKAFKAAFDGDYAKAYKLLEEDSVPESQALFYKVGEKIATLAGDGYKALQYAFNLEDLNEKVFINHRGFEFAELNDVIENENLRVQAADQEMQQARMALDNLHILTELKELEEHNKELRRKAAEIERDNQLVATLNQQREDSLHKAESERDFANAQLVKEQQERNRMTYRYIAAVLAVLIIVFCGLMVYYGRTSKSLLHHALVLRKAKSSALEAADMKNVFIQNMSHEIRTPLNAVMGFSQLMTIPGLPLSDEEKVEYAGHILNNSKMLTMLVDDILNIAEIEKGNYSVTPAECRANEIMGDAISTAEYRAQPGVSVYYTSDVDDGFTIIADARRVQQVLINFLTNACKHTEQGSIHLHLSITETPGMLSYSVTDTGCGIPKEQAENIFERFTKLNDFKQGTGLGLNICRLIATKMNGRVYCDTRYTAGGARFVFEVPLVTKA